MIVKAVKTTENLEKTDRLELKVSEQGRDYLNYRNGKSLVCIIRVVHVDLNIQTRSQKKFWTMRIHSSIVIQVSALMYHALDLLIKTHSRFQSFERKSTFALILPGRSAVANLAHVDNWSCNLHGSIIKASDEVLR